MKIDEYLTRQEELKILKTALRRYFFQRLLQKISFGLFDLPHKYCEGFCHYFRMLEPRTLGIPATLAKVYEQKKEQNQVNPIYLGLRDTHYFWYKPGDLYSRIQILTETIERLKNEEDDD